MITVEFRQHYDRYNPRERAGFPDAEARRLVTSGAAVVVKPIDEAAPPKRRRGRPPKNPRAVITK